MTSPQIAQPSLSRHIDTKKQGTLLDVVIYYECGCKMYRLNKTFS